MSISSGYQWFRSHCLPATKQDLKETEDKIMSAITDWAAKEQVSLDAISSTLDGILVGIAALDALIIAFQNSPGTLNAVDQAALDAIQTSSASLLTKSQGIVLTPPTPPASPAA